MGLRSMVPDLPPVLGREDNTDEGPRKLWAAECRALGEQMPHDGKVHDALLLTNGAGVYRAIRKGLKIALVTPMIYKTLAMGNYDPVASAVAARANSLKEYKQFMDGRIAARVAQSKARNKKLESLELEDDEEDDAAGHPDTKSATLRMTAAAATPESKSPSNEESTEQGGAPALLPWPHAETEDVQDEEDGIQVLHRG